MEIARDSAAAWAQAFLSALAILASALFAIWLPRRERRQREIELQRRAAQTLWWGVSMATAQRAVFEKECLTSYMMPNELAVMATEMTAMADEVRAVRTIDLPTDAIATVWQCHILVRYWAEAWQLLREARSRNITVESRELAEIDKLADAALDSLGKIKIGGMPYGNPLTNPQL